jgi:hypothetical protein
MHVNRTTAPVSRRCDWVVTAALRLGGRLVIWLLTGMLRVTTASRIAAALENRENVLVECDLNNWTIGGVGENGERRDENK